MAAASGCSSSVPSLPPPRPKSPPEYPDLYGKRRELAKVQMLEREIGFLQEELRSVEDLQPASRCCKEVADFVVANSDPLVPTNRKIRRSGRFWKWICGASCFNFSWICCKGCCNCCKGCCNCFKGCCNCCKGCCNEFYNECCPHLEMPHCCDCNLCNCHSCISCSLPKCQCCSLSCCRCLNKISCSRSCCTLQCPSCPDCSCSSCGSCSSCSRWTCSFPKCPKVHLSSCCTKSCCYPCCLCY